MYLVGVKLERLPLMSGVWAPPVVRGTLYTSEEIIFHKILVFVAPSVLYALKFEPLALFYSINLVYPPQFHKSPCSNFRIAIEVTISHK